MAAITEPPSESFRLSQLIYDTRYRSLTIQVIAFLLIMAGLAWLANNVAQNLTREFGFGFLTSRSGYDINQRLIEYTNDAPHARAALVGMINTLFVAALGCLTATLVGVIAGVLRLSKNWLVARLMSVYVEGFRNIPLVLWIVLIFAIISESTPNVGDFVPGGTADYDLFGTSAITSSATYIPRPVFADGALWIFALVLAASIGAIVLVRRGAAAYQARTGQPLPIFPISVVLLIGPLIAAYYVMAPITTDRERQILAADAPPGQTLAAYAEEQGRVDFCLIPGDLGSVNLGRLMDARGIDYRVIPTSTEALAIRQFSQGNCVVMSVAPDEAGRISDLIADISARRLLIVNTVTGIDFQTPEEAGEEPLIERDPLQLATLDTTHPEGRPAEISFPEVRQAGLVAQVFGGWTLLNSLIALWFALSLYTGAFVAEIVRSGILSVSRGQSEAAFALGIKPGQTMRLVILPQALRVIVPPLISQYLNLTKNSSLALAVGYMDVRSTLGGITINQTGRELEGMLLMGLFYLVTSFAISAVLNVYNNRIKFRER